MGAGSDIPPARAPTQLTRAKAMAQTVREKALIRQAREDGRPSEDDVAQERLGWRGQKGRPRPAMMTEESKKETSPDLDPGRTRRHRPRYPTPDGAGSKAAASAGQGRCRKKNPADGGALSSGTNELRGS